MKRAIFSVFFCLLYFKSTGLFAQQTIKFADSPYPPYVIGEPEGKAPKGGTAVDLVNQLFNELPEYRAEFNLMPWKRVLRDLEHGTVDAVTMVAYTPERADFLDFSAPLIEYQLALFYKKERFPNGLKWQQLSDLSQYKIGVVEGYLSDSKMHELADQGTPLSLLRLSGTEEQLFGMLLRDRVDIICFKLESGTTLLRQKNWSSLIEPDPKVIYRGSYHLGFSKAQQHAILINKLNGIIKKWQDNGKLESILHPHSPEH
ncbi:MAG: transporter substrate-binding domain-containing protein [Gammaproteobacteria bacterium]|nr:transporter substrate-binding domain-containing protein [Gammaproteobacteria bacterium]